MRGEVLVVGSDHEYVAQALACRLPDGIGVRSAGTAAATEGIGVDVVVVAGGHVLEEARQIRVHGRIGSAAVVVVAPGHIVLESAFADRNVYVTRRDPGVIDDIVRHVVHLISVARHPSFSVPDVQRPKRMYEDRVVSRTDLS